MNGRRRANVWLASIRSVVELQSQVQHDRKNADLASNLLFCIAFKNKCLGYLKSLVYFMYMMIQSYIVFYIKQRKFLHVYTGNLSEITYIIVFENLDVRSLY